MLKLGLIKLSIRDLRTKAPQTWFVLELLCDKEIAIYNLAQQD